MVRKRFFEALRSANESQRGVSPKGLRCPWLVCLKMDGAGLDGFHFVYQGHLFVQKAMLKAVSPNRKFRNPQKNAGCPLSGSKEVPGVSMTLKKMGP